MAAVPFAGGATEAIVSVSRSGSISFARTLIETGVANAVVTASSAATGARFGCAATVTTTTALLTPPWPSSIVYVKRATPENPGAGVNTSAPELIATLPAGGCVTLTMVSGLPSGSLSFERTLIVTG